MADRHLTSEETLDYLKHEHGMRRSSVWLQKAHADNRLPASRYDGRRRQYEVSALDDFANQHFNNSPKDEEGIPT